MSSRSVLLVRHCESSGQAPYAPLTARGAEQAEQLAHALASQPITRIVSSPYARAGETIAPLARRLGLDVSIDPRLRERLLSPEPREDWREHVARAFLDPDARAPGGESAREVLARGWAALADALAAGDSVLVSHGQLLSLVLHRIDTRFGYAGWEAMANPDVFRVEQNVAGDLRYERFTL